MEFANALQLTTRITTMSSPHTPNVAIVGAGLSGLTLARVLQKNGVSCTIFEAEADLNSRDQGGSLDMNPDTGARALELCGLLGQFHAHCRPEGDELRVTGIYFERCR